jgi:hypothetical protein
LHKKTHLTCAIEKQTASPVEMWRYSMQTATDRKTALKAASRPMTHADKELEAMTAYMKKVTSSKKASQTFLENAGIVDKQGRLAKPYRP